MISVSGFSANFLKQKTSFPALTNFNAEKWAGIKQGKCRINTRTIFLQLTSHRGVALPFKGSRKSPTSNVKQTTILRLEQSQNPPSCTQPTADFHSESWKYAVIPVACPSFTRAEQFAFSQRQRSNCMFRHN